MKDDSGMQREYFGEPPPEGNIAPEIKIEGELARSVKVGEVSTLTVTVTDDGIPRTGRGAGAGAGGGAAPSRPPNAAAGGGAGGPPRARICGDNRAQFFCGEPNEGAGALFSVKGLRMNCFLYRGDPEKPGPRGDFGHAASVVFDPPQEKVWEDHRGGSPWASGYVLPPVPKDNKWVIQTSFTSPGTYVVRCQAHDGLLVTNQNLTFTVTP